MYIDDGDARRLEAAKFNYLKNSILKEITCFLERVNPFIKDFRRLALEPSEKAHLVFECTTRRRAGPILGEQPQSTEVAAVISLIDEPNDPRQICIWKNGEGKRQLNVFHPIMEPFQYPLLYPRGELGWTINMKDNQGGKLSQLKYIRCLLLSQERFTAFNKLSETWCQQNPTTAAMRMATAAEVIDANELNKQRQEVRQNAQDDETIRGEGFVAGRIYLPCSFTGGPRYMKIKYMNAMTLVERLDKALRRTPFKLLPPNYFYTLLDPSINWRN
ncbi:unnamed protein product [Phyllotreta striolata]|uniref:Helitron helicase-like domain-containing protein n=1 Tax=Phyllotreta striolata TaxID=444603 RepID=A0A9N9TTD5_PHYSR|nr:unnamed protein product [Phyllotreta striolata]